ncbi:hypothetical protein KKG41_05865 [Patescibacteria group bacterium]|nr:hypothetical protein [Patescibacteria group bacterium]MBU1889971.1 hypothetical protein [Patescibacteria group bacterium]
MRFITTAYGNDYIGFLLTCIFSITKSNPDAAVSVFWSDIDKTYIELLNQTFPNVEFKKNEVDIPRDFIKRISSKTILWNKAIELYPDEQICLLDSDTLVLKDISHFFENDFDISFTIKDERIPLNTGVMLVKNSGRVTIFFQEWQNRTNLILNDPKEYANANNTDDYPYGGTDQMSFYNLINYSKGQNSFTADIAGESVKLIALPCAQLNETRSTNITPEKHILHYKGGWRPILLDGTNFTSNRPKEKSLEMYKLFLKTFSEAIEAIQKIDPQVRMRDFNIRVPYYLNIETGQENKLKYFVYKTMNTLFFNNIRRINKHIK